MTGTGSAPAKTTSMASMTRESSPPEAPLCTGRGGRAGVRGQQQRDLVDALGPGLRRGRLSMEKDTRALFIASPASSRPTSAAKPSAAARRPAETCAAELVDLGAGGVAGGGQRLQRLVGDVELGQPAARRPRPRRSTPATPSPGSAYLRTSAVIAARRSSTSASRPGSASRSAT